MKDQLSEDAAGHLQLEIDDLQDEIDEDATVGDALAIVVDGDTAPKAITSGQYLYIKNHSTLPSGGYHATANITNGGSVTSSNVAADADGVVNALNSKMGLVVERITFDQAAVSANSAKDYFKDVTKDGYTPILATPYSTFSSGVTWIACFFTANDPNKVQITVRNFTSGSINCTPSCYVVYQKT